MKKRTRKRGYRVVDIKKVDEERLANMVRGEEVVFSVDVAKERPVGSVVLASSEAVKLNIGWANPVESRLVVELVERLPAAKVEVAMEPSGTYGDPLRWLFSERGIEVFRVSPKRSHDAAEVYDGVPSWHDAKSAAVIAKLHLDGASERWPERPKAERDMAAAVRTMEMYDKQAAANRNRLEALLARHWPELPMTMELGSATLLNVVMRYGSPAAVAADEEGVRALMRRVGRQFLKEEKIEAVVDGAVDSVGVPPTERETRGLQELAAEILRCRVEERKATREVEARAQGEETTERLASVIGKKTAAVVVVGVGDPGQYESATSLVKGMGLNLKERSSGKFKGQLKITKRGPGRCRYYLYLAALRLIVRDPVVGAWYHQKVARDGGKVKSKAVVAVMRKLTMGLWHVARGAKFDATLLFDVDKLGIQTEAQNKAEEWSHTGVLAWERTFGFKHVSELLDVVNPI